MKTVVQTARKVTGFMVIEVLSSSRGSHIAILLFPRSGQSKHALFLSYALLWPLPSPLRLIKLACRACWEERDPGIWQRAVLSPLTWMPLTTRTALYKWHRMVLSRLCRREWKCYTEGNLLQSKLISSPVYWCNSHEWTMKPETY